MMNNKDTEEIYLLTLIKRENNLVIDEILLGVYNNLDKLKFTSHGYILKNKEELYIATKKLNEKLINRDIDFENEECMKINEDYLNKIIS